jgi:hypothetical protein
VKIHLPVVGPDLPVHPTKRHPRTGEPLQAVGFTRRGQVMWPVLGASPDDDSDGDDDDDSDDGDPGADGDDDKGEGDTDDLRDAGKKALDAMKGQRNKARTALRPWTALAREHGVNTPDELRNLLKGKKPDGGDTPDPEQIRREARAEADREVARDRVFDKIEAKAGGRFADPADAAALLLREGAVDDFLDGTKVDADAISEALDELLERKPYLAAGKQAPERKNPKPDKSQGNRSGAKLSAQERAKQRLERMGLGKPAA